MLNDCCMLALKFQLFTEICISVALDWWDELHITERDESVANETRARTITLPKNIPNILSYKDKFPVTWSRGNYVLRRSKTWQKNWQTNFLTHSSRRICTLTNATIDHSNRYRLAIGIEHIRSRTNYRLVNASFQFFSSDRIRVKHTWCSFINRDTVKK